MTATVPTEVKRPSSTPLDRAFARAWFKGAGLTDRELERPLIGVVTSWNDFTPESMHLSGLADAARAGVQSAGGTPVRFDVIHFSDALTTASDAMRMAMPSRELVADCTEIMTLGHGLAGLVLIPGGDKVVPGMLLGAARAGVPSVFLYAGSTGPGLVDGAEIGWTAVVEGAIGVASGRLVADELLAFEDGVLPGPGGGSEAYTGNTMAMAVEALGLSLPGTATLAAGSSAQLRAAKESGWACVQLLRVGRPIADSLTPASLERALRVVAAVGGSLNAVLHLLALAEEHRLPISLETVDAITRKTPHLVPLRPSGTLTIADLHAGGGVPAVLAALGEAIPSQESIAPPDTPEFGRRNAGHNVFSQGSEGETGAIRVLRGSLAPGGALVRLSAVPAGLRRHEGPARVFDDEAAAVEAILAGTVRPGDVVVVRFQGPQGGPGFPEMLGVSAALQGTGLGDSAVLVTDGRLSGASRGAAIAYIDPEAALGGPLARVADGDEIEIDLLAGRIDLRVDQTALAARTPARPPRRALTRTLDRYASLVCSASRGAVLSTPEEAALP